MLGCTFHAIDRDVLFGMCATKQCKTIYYETYYYGPRSRSFWNYPTIEQFLRHNPRGVFYVTCRGHAFAIVDGKVFDNGAVRTTRRRIVQAWRVDNPQHVSPPLPEPTTLAQSVQASWQDSAVRHARTQHHKVSVGGQEYNSVHAAFVALGLPLNRHQAFRKELKANGQATFGAHTFWLID